MPEHHTRNQTQVQRPVRLPAQQIRSSEVVVVPRSQALRHDGLDIGRDAFHRREREKYHAVFDGGVDPAGLEEEPLP